MTAAANLGVVPVIVIIAVVFIVIIWLVRFFLGIKQTKDFYRQKMEERNASEPEAENSSAGLQERDTDNVDSET